jgi:imidazolonepropionase-like amidohydrolase
LDTECSYKGKSGKREKGVGEQLLHRQRGIVGRAEPGIGTSKGRNKSGQMDVSTHMKNTNRWLPGTVGLQVLAFILLPAALMAGLAAAQSKGKAEGVIAVVHVNVIPMNREIVLRDQTVVVADGKIQSVGPAESTVISAGARKIDASGKYLIPGLTDSHVHLQTPIEFPVFLANGVTTVYNLDGRPAHLAWRKKIASGEMTGPRIFSTGPIFFQAATAEEAVRKVDEQGALGYDGVKIYNGVSKEAYGPLVAEAKAKNMLLMGHVARKPDFEATLDAGQSIAHLEEYTYTFFNPKRDDDDTHIVYDESKIPEAVRLTVKAGIFVTPTLANYATIVQQATDLDEFLKNPELRYDSPWIRAGFQPDVDRYKNGFKPDAYPRLRASLALQRKLVKALEDAGVPILSGTDASDVGPVAGFGLHHELQEFVNDGFTPYQSLRTATVNPALYFHQSDQWGTIETGKRADMVLLDGNPLENIGNTTKIAGLILQGKWIEESKLHADLMSVPAQYETQIREMTSLLEKDPAKAESLMVEIDPFESIAASALERIADGKNANSLEATLRQIRSKLPNSNAVSEAAINTLGYQLYRRHKNAQAIAVLRLNTQEFPKSANTWDSLGEVLLNSGDVSGGVANYKKALEVDPNYPNAAAARKIIAEHEAPTKASKE